MRDKTLKSREEHTNEELLIAIMEQVEKRCLFGHYFLNYGGINSVLNRKLIDKEVRKKGYVVEWKENDYLVLLWSI